MKEKLQKVKELVHDIRISGIIDDNCLIYEPTQEVEALIDSILAELGSLELVEKVAKVMENEDIECFRLLPYNKNDYKAQAKAAIEAITN